MKRTKRYERGGDVDEGVSGGASIDEMGRRIDADTAEQTKAPAEVKLTPKQIASLNSDGGMGRVTGTRDDDFSTAGFKTANTRNGAGDFNTAQGERTYPFFRNTSTGNSNEYTDNKKRGGVVKKMANGGVVSASRRADGIAQRGKTRGKMC
jgi:hypothetical protein